MPHELNETQMEYKTALESFDYVQIPSKTSKAATMRNKHTGILIFIQPCGTLRIGESYTGSSPLPTDLLIKINERIGA